jgi:hypothetical protein
MQLFIKQQTRNVSYKELDIAQAVLAHSFMQDPQLLLFKCPNPYVQLRSFYGSQKKIVAN